MLCLIHFPDCCDLIQLTSNAGVSGLYEATGDIINQKAVWKKGEYVIFFYTRYSSWTVGTETFITEGYGSIFHSNQDDGNTECPTDILTWSNQGIMECQTKRKFKHE